MVHSRARRLLLSGAVLGASGALVLGVAGPALADTPELTTASGRWFDIGSSSPYIGDAESGYLNLLGSGVDLPFGWTGDAFDGVLYGWTATDALGVSTPINWTGVSENVDPTGISTWTYTGSALGATYTASLEIAGSTARWVITPTGTTTATVSAIGDLGSDGNETVVVVTPNAAVVSSDGSNRDPVLGYWFDAPGATWAQSSGSGAFSLEFDGTGPATVVIAFQDFAVCAKQTAIDEMVARVPTLGAQFGTEIIGALECASVTAPQQLTVGASTSQTLDVTLDAAIDAFLSSGNPPFDLASGVVSYFGDPSLIGSTVVGLPAGVTGTFDAATQRLVLAGTPTTAGTFEVSTIIYRTDVEDYWFGVAGNGIPLVANFTLTVAAPELAATGAESTWAIGGIAALLVAAGALALTAGSARRHSTR